MKPCSLAALMIAGAAAFQQTPPPIIFRDVTKSAGVTFHHDNAHSEQRYLIETMGAGAEWIYLVNSTETKAYRPRRPLTSALYRNRHDGTFTDVTEKAGVAATDLFGMGVAVGDYDNDGFQDLYVVGYGRSILYRNNGDGTFTDVTRKSRMENLGKLSAIKLSNDIGTGGKRLAEAQCRKTAHTHGRSPPRRAM